MPLSSPGPGTFLWSASTDPKEVPVDLFLRNGISSVPVALVPNNDGIIRMKNPKIIQAELRSVTAQYQSITEVRQFGRGGILCSSPDQSCVLDLLKCSTFASQPDPKDTPPPTRVETREERIERKRREKAEQVAYKLEQDIALWDPYNNSSGTLDPFKTLFVARINYDTSESKLRREFEVFGPIKKIVIVHNKITGKPRGYAFVEYEHERDMHSAYKHADGKKIDGRRVLVDVERGRTVKGWLPRRLGGGLGGTRRGGPDVNTKHSGREDSRMDERYMDRDGRDREDRMIRGGEPRGGGVGGERDRERERRRSRSRDRERRHRSGKDDRERRERRRDRPDRERPDRERPDRERPDRERSDRERPERDRGDRDRGDRERRDRGDRPDGGEVPPEREKRRRSRSRERKRKRSRSRSREHRRRRERNGSERGVDGIKQELVSGDQLQQHQPQDGFAEDSRSAGGLGGNYESTNAEGYGSGVDGGSGYNSESQSSFKMERTEEYN